MATQMIADQHVRSSTSTPTSSSPTTLWSSRPLPSKWADISPRVQSHVDFAGRGTFWFHRRHPGPRRGVGAGRRRRPGHEPPCPSHPRAQGTRCTSRTTVHPVARGEGTRTSTACRNRVLLTRTSSGSRSNTLLTVGDSEFQIRLRARVQTTFLVDWFAPPRPGRFVPVMALLPVLGTSTRRSPRSERCAELGAQGDPVLGRAEEGRLPAPARNRHWDPILGRGAGATSCRSTSTVGFGSIPPRNRKGAGPRDEPAGRPSTR